MELHSPELNPVPLCIIPGPKRSASCSQQNLNAACGLVRYAPSFQRLVGTRSALSAVQISISIAGCLRVTRYLLSRPMTWTTRLIRSNRTQAETSCFEDRLASAEISDLFPGSAPGRIISDQGPCHEDGKGKNNPDKGFDIKPFIKCKAD